MDHNQRICKASTVLLSPREKQIVHLIQQAKSNKLIAHELRLAEGTIKEYIFHIFRKLGAANRTAVAIWGLENAEALGTNQDAVAA